MTDSPTPPKKKLAEVSLSLVTDAKTHGRTERLAEGRLSVTTPKGLNPQDHLLIEGMEATPFTHALTAMTATALPALATRALHPEAACTYFHIDLFKARQAAALAAAHGIAGLECLCEPNMPALPEPPNLVLASFARDGETGLACEWVQQAWARLAKGGKLLAAINTPHDKWLRARLISVFGEHLTLLQKNPNALLYLVKKVGATPQPEHERASEQFIKHIEVAVGEDHLTFETCYGLFTSDALDQGSLALLEMLELPEPCASILDLGCGWGAMGIFAARRAKASRLMMIDANARAVQMARRNAAMHLTGVDAVVRHEADVQSLERPAEAGRYDVVVTNPPYWADLRVAERFIEVSRRTLRPKGALWLVCKQNPRLEECIQTAFGNLQVLRRRGYTVLKSTNPSA